MNFLSTLYCIYLGVTIVSNLYISLSLGNIISFVSCWEEKKIRTFVSKIKKKRTINYILFYFRIFANCAYYFFTHSNKENLIGLSLHSWLYSTASTVRDFFVNINWLFLSIFLRHESACTGYPSIVLHYAREDESALGCG